MKCKFLKLINALGLAIILALVIAPIIGCGGEGGEENPPEKQNVGAGWITIESTKSDPQNAYLSGKAFISPDWWHCCSGSAEDTGVNVTWTNTATGESGWANQHAKYFCLFSSCQLSSHTWDARIPIAPGTNNIEVMASDPFDNIGHASVTISPGPPPPDLRPPNVISTTPANNAFGVAISDPITATFSEPMDPASVNSSSFILSDANGLVEPISVSYSGATAIFTPISDLAYSNSYTVRITTHSRDIAGNALSADYVWTFTTASSPDTTTPSVVSVNPENNETCAATDSSITVTFSEPINSSSVNTSNFLVTDGAGAAITGTLTVSGTLVAFHPTLGLAYNAPYTATITADVTDMAGNAMANEYTWGFTTQQSLVGTWQSVTENDAPVSRTGPTAVWTGSEMIVWGGFGLEGWLGSGGRYDPAKDAWLPIATDGAPTGRGGHTAVWTGYEMIVWGGMDENGVLNTGGRYDPVTDTWQPISTDGAPTASRRHVAVWTGYEMIVWGGVDENSVLNTGGRYDPVTDTWQPVSTNGAPTGPTGTSTAVWTGSEMIVWGGTYGTPNLGARYDPATDTWRAMSTVGAPPWRDGYSAVWTGSEMIIWGGWEFSPFTAVQTGAVYNPVSDSWQPVPLTCAPSARTDPAAVWTGTQMIVWGGEIQTHGMPLNSGGVYDPSTGIWHATQFLGAPTARSSPIAVWTGTQMVIWGGEGALSVNSGTGMLYSP